MPVEPHPLPQHEPRCTSMSRNTGEQCVKLAGHDRDHITFVGDATYVWHNSALNAWRGTRRLMADAGRA